MTEQGFDELTRAFSDWFTSSDRRNTSTRLGPDDDAPPQIAIVDKRGAGRGRAVIALQDIQPDTILFTVDHADILSILTSEAHELLTPAQTSACPPWAACVLALIFEHGRGIEGKWWPYLSVLPDRFDTLIHWSDDELSELQGSHVTQKIGRAGAETTFEEILWPVIQTNADRFGSYAAVFANPNRGVAREAFFQLAHRFATLVMAYAFDLDVDDVERDPEKSVDEDGFVEETPAPKGMIPFADMLNAEGEELNNARLFHGERSVSMVSIKSIGSGCEVFNDYGSLPNSEILRCYGYTSSAYDQHDVVEIETEKLVEAAKRRFGLDEKQVDRRLSIADRWDILDESFDLSRNPTDEASLDDGLLLVLLLLTSNDDEFKDHKQMKRLPKARLTERIAELLTHVVQQRQADYSTTIAQDRALQKSMGKSRSSNRVQMAVKIRLGEKEILYQTLDYLQKWAEQQPDGDVNNEGPRAKRAKH